MMSTKAAAEVAPAAALTTETREEALTGGVPMGAVPTESRGGISPKACQTSKLLLHLLSSSFQTCYLAPRNARSD